MKTRPILWTILACVAAVLAGCGNQGGQSSGAAAPASPDTSKAQTPATAPIAADEQQTPPPPPPPPGTPPAGDTPVEVTPPAAPVPDLVARVAGKDITKAQFEREYAVRTRQLQMRSGRRVPPGDDVSAMILKNIIESETLAVLAERAGIKVTDEELQTEFQKSKKQMPSEEDYQAYLKREDLTEAALLELIRGSMTVSRYIDGVTASLQVSDEELNQEYERLKGAGLLSRKTDTTDVAHILVKVAPGADEAAWEAGKQHIDEARARVQAGESFADVAKEVSQDPGSAQRGGAYKDVPAGRMVPEFEEKMLSTPVGQVSEPFRTSYGWHILTVTGKHPAGPIAFEDAKEDLSQGALAKKRREAVRTILDDAKKSMDVEVLYLKDLVYPPESPSTAVPGGAGAPGVEPAPATETPPPAADAGAAATQAAAPAETPAPPQ